MRYRLDVVATSIVDVVEHAGGWLFDRAVAGWDVTVLLADPSDSRPLRILGAETLDLETVLAAGGQGRRPHALAVACEVCSLDPRAQRGLRKALGDGGIEVVVWGEGWSAPPEHRVDPVLHRLSVAAQAFKAQALTAAAVPASVGATESFRSGLSGFPSIGADLSPVG
ncbi:hypothetical protein BJY24_004403 [Nocardia transvalensis]|uniref:Uncharacterized protein n=1 Tax=Nocardia transvalensis TaxID=37333 RepID=A0A7W9PFZ5_9NOCA|nr:hypothetical protein [Nocardia transvalensis]MBB5915491.1 hypothetical protein [Nocardia transvalensis]